MLTDQEPASVAIHDENADWLVGDGVNDPNLPGASVVACIGHVVDADPTAAELSTLPPGHVAERDKPNSAWTARVHERSDE